MLGAGEQPHARENQEEGRHRRRRRHLAVSPEERWWQVVDLSGSLTCRPCRPPPFTPVASSPKATASSKPSVSSKLR